MSDRTRKTLVFAFLIVASVWGYFNLTGRKAKRADRDQPAAAAPTVPVNPAAVSPAGVMPEDMVDYYSDQAWGENPFYHGFSRVDESPPSPEVALHLLGILYRELNAQALINGQVLREGDILEGYRVVKITPDHVDLHNGDKTITLRVTKESS